MKDIIGKVLQKEYIPEKAKINFNSTKPINVLEIIPQTRGILNSICKELTWEITDPRIYSRIEYNDNIYGSSVNIHNHDYILENEAIIEHFTTIKISDSEKSELISVFDDKMPIKKINKDTEGITYELYPSNLIDRWIDNYGLNIKPLKVVLYIGKFKDCYRKDYQHYHNYFLNERKIKGEFHEIRGKMEDIREKFSDSNQDIVFIYVQFLKHLESRVREPVLQRFRNPVNITKQKFNIGNNHVWNYFYISEKKDLREMSNFFQKKITCDNFYDYAQPAGFPRKKYTWSMKQLKEAMFKVTKFGDKYNKLKFDSKNHKYPAEQYLIMKRMKKNKNTSINNRNNLTIMFDAICQLREREKSGQSSSKVIKKVQENVKPKIQKDPQRKQLQEQSIETKAIMQRIWLKLGRKLRKCAITMLT